MTILLKRNDTKDTISYTMTYADGTPVNLTGATVRFFMGNGKSLISDGAAVVKSANAGQVEYTLTDADTLIAGTFKAEFQVTFSDGKVKTFPTNGYIMVNIQPNMDVNQSTYIEDQIANRVSDLQVWKGEIQSQLDQFAKGDSAPEVAQARVEKDGTTNTTLKARLDKKEAEFSSGIQNVAAQLAQIVTDVKRFGAKGDGVTDDSNAVVQANGEGRILYFPKGHFKVNSIPSNTKIKGINGAGIGETTIEFADDVQFLIDNGFVLSGVTIISNSAKISTELTKPLLFSNTDVKNCLFENIDFRTNASEIGDLRGASLLEGYVKNSVFKNITLSGVRVGFCLYGKGLVDNKISDISFINTQTGFYISNKESNYNQIDETKMYKVIQFNNISLINTQQQQQNYTQPNGCNLFMFEQVKEATIINVYSERAIERTGYLNNCQNINLNNFINNDCEGYHFGGYINIDSGVYNISKGFRAVNGTFSRGGGRTDRDHCFMLYDCEDVVIENIKAKGSDSIDLILSNAFLTGHAYLKDVVIKNIIGANFNRNFIQFTNESLSQTDHSGNAWFRKTEMYNILIDNCKGENTNLGQFSYPAIRFDTSQTVMDSIGENNHVFNNIQVKNCTFKQGESLGFNGSSKLRGLVRANSVNGLYVGGNEVFGHNVRDSVEVGVKSKNVFITTRTTHNDNVMWASNDLHVSGGSEVSRHHYTDTMNLRCEYKPVTKIVSIGGTIPLGQECNININGEISLNPTENILLFLINNTNYKFAELKVIRSIDGLKGEYIHRLNSAMLVSGDDLFAGTDTAGKISFYVTATGLRLKNNTNDPVTLLLSGFSIYQS